MKPNSPFGELSGDEARNLSPAERTKRFLACKAKHQAGDADVSKDGTHWYVIDEDMPLHGLDALPRARPGDTRTPLVWVKFRDPSAGKVVVSKGHYDHDGGTWTARLSSVEDGDVIGRVVALAWARITPGERPWEGLIVRTNEADPW